MTGEIINGELAILGNIQTHEMHRIVEIWRIVMPLRSTNIFQFVSKYNTSLGDWSLSFRCWVNAIHKVYCQQPGILFGWARNSGELGNIWINQCDAKQFFLTDWTIVVIPHTTEHWAITKHIYIQAVHWAPRRRVIFICNGNSFNLTFAESLTVSLQFFFSLAWVREPRLCIARRHFPWRTLHSMDVLKHVLVENIMIFCVCSVAITSLKRNNILAVQHCRVYCPDYITQHIQNAFISF